MENRCFGCEGPTERRCLACYGEKVEREVLARVVARLRRKAAVYRGNIDKSIGRALDDEADAIERGEWKGGE